MDASRFAGLAVALAIGSAIAGAGPATADPTESQSSHDDSGPIKSGPAAERAVDGRARPDRTATRAPAGHADDVAPDSRGRHSGVPPVLPAAPDRRDPFGVFAAGLIDTGLVRKPSPAAAAAVATSQRTVPGPAASTATAPDLPAVAPLSPPVAASASAAAPVAPMVLAVPIAAPVVAVPAAAMPTRLAAAPLAAGLDGLLDRVLGALNGSAPGLPSGDAPLSWAVLAAARRPVEPAITVAAAIPSAAAANRRPVISKIVVGSPNPVTAVVVGTVTASDPDGDKITYTATTSSKGKVAITAVGEFTYTPTAAARHAAARVGAATSATTDTVRVTVTDTKGAATSQTVAVPILPQNTAPTTTVTVGTPNVTTGVVTGKVTGTDADRDPLKYAIAAAPAKGSVTLTATTGAFTYTPSASARTAASQPGATTADRTDSFTIRVTDGYGGAATQLVGVAVQPNPTVPRSLSWGGQVWTIKSSSGAVGPGPNVFDATNPTVDSSGYLHLRIARNASGSWTSSEIIGPTSLGYGTYTFTLGSDVSSLDPNAVLGLFTWSDNPAYANRELDIEFSRWGVATDPTNAQYVIQPFDAAGHLRRFTQPAVTVSTHSFTWSPASVSWVSRDAAGSPIAAYTYTGPDIPVPGDERVRLNLWLYRGAAPVRGLPVEVVVRSFTFTPLPAAVISV